MIRILLSKKLGELRWTQADLYRATGIRKATINEYYNELTDRVDLQYLDKICEVLGCDLDEILVRETDSPSKARIRRSRKKRSG